MQDNPYSTLINIMRNRGSDFNTPGIQLAEVIAPPPNLLIKVGDLQVDKKNILIADYLIPGYNRQYSQGGSGTISTKDSGGTSSPYTVLESINATGKVTLTDTLQKGNVLAVIPTSDEQTYIILARVVSI